jgi:predicted AAA+ superfamily ATPase
LDLERTNKLKLLQAKRSAKKCVNKQRVVEKSVFKIKKSYEKVYFCSTQVVFMKRKSDGVKQIYYWANDTGSAEVDFILEHDNKIVPIEVKANENLQSKSLKTFSSKYSEIHCFRTSLSDFRIENWMTNIPLYGVKRLFVI